MGTHPLEDRLSRLAEKYRALAGLRARRELAQAAGRAGLEGEEATVRRLAFRRIAEEFPGALRELDTTPARILSKRAAEVEEAALRLRAASEGALPAWIAVTLDYHAMLREALAVKRWLAHRLPRGGEVTAGLLESFAAWYARFPHRHGAAGPVDRAFLERHLHPPGGRIQAAIWEAVASRHGITRAEAERLVFGPRP